jgi:hypothetical protein
MWRFIAPPELEPKATPRVARSWSLLSWMLDFAVLHSLICQSLPDSIQPRRAAASTVHGIACGSA